jgi:nitric oxide reductase subunit C
MTNYHFTDAQIDDLVAFFEWVGKVDLNGFPAKPTLGPAAQAAPRLAAERPQIFSQLCITCHSLEGAGGTVGPALDGVGSRRDATYLKQWLENPLAMKADSKMPKLPLDEAQIGELVTFLSSQKTQKEVAQ